MAGHAEAVEDIGPGTRTGGRSTGTGFTRDDNIADRFDIFVSRLGRLRIITWGDFAAADHRLRNEVERDCQDHEETQHGGESGK
jgi:hypothetical protein